MIREFALENEYAERVSLTVSPELGALLLEPAGLGFSMQNKYTRVGHVYKLTDSSIDQSEISGDLIFSTYEGFRSFANFIARSGSLKLLYRCVEGDGWYYRDVDVKELEKGEITDEKVLTCPVTFECRTLYYQDDTITYIVAATAMDRRYSIPYPNRYSDFSERTDILSNDGHIPAPVTCVISGYCENPRIQLMDGEKNAVYDITFPVTLQEGESVEYSSMDGAARAEKVGADGTRTNIVNLLDLENDNWIRVPIGAYTLRFSSDTGTANRTSYVMHRFFKAV